MAMCAGIDFLGVAYVPVFADGKVCTWHLVDFSSVAGRERHCLYLTFFMLVGLVLIQLESTKLGDELASTEV